MTNLGDLNKDGYEDIAIGAPYEKKGTVYIYLGSKNGIITVPSQVSLHYYVQYYKNKLICCVNISFILR